MDPRIVELKEKGFTVWSYSRINCGASKLGEGCDWEYYMNYILKTQGEDSIYGFLGGSAHDCLEQLYRGDIKYEDMHTIMKGKIVQAKIMGKSFPRGDSEEKNWTQSVLHFMKTHKQFNYEKSLLEVLILIEIAPGIYFQGYVDAIFVDRDGNLHIYDWKTSSKSSFGKDKILKTGRQLVFYKKAVEAITGLKVVETAWNMLKYCELHYNNVTKAKNIKPSKLTCMRNDVENQIIAKLGNLLSPTDFIMGQMSYIEGSLDFSCFPNYDFYNFRIEDHIIQYNVTEELENECIDYFIETIKDIESKDKNNENDWKQYKSNYLKDGIIDNYCTTLCGMKRHCPQFQSWKLEKDLTED